jgi:hypothetical protein
MTERDLENQRYAITDKLSDFDPARSDAEALILAAALVGDVGDFILARQPALERYGQVAPA